MAVGKISFLREDGNLNTPAIGSDHVSGLPFDIPANTSMPAGIKLGDVVQIFSLNEAVSLGVTEYDEEGVNFYHGIPHFHISEYFRMKPDGSLYIMFANCANNWDAIKTMQSVAQGEIRQLGIWTAKNLWPICPGDNPYTLNLVADINSVAEVLANEHRPLSVLLGSNTSCADSTKANKTINLTKIPTCIGDFPRVTALIGQGKSDTLRKMQISHPDNATIGTLGTALGCVSNAKVCESIAWVDQFNRYNKN